MKNVGKINVLKLLVYCIFFTIYMLPIKYLETINPNIDAILFASIILIIYIMLIKKNSIYEILFIAIIMYIVIINKSIVYLHLLSIPVLYKIISKKELRNNIEDIILNSHILEISFIFVIIYSIIYFGTDGRYAYTGIAEPNQSGFAIFFLALLMLKKNKVLGNIIMIIGIFTMSRNYFVAVIIFMFFKLCKNSKIILRMQKKINFRNFTIISITLLVLLSYIFTYFYKQGKVSEYQTGFERFTSFIDYSNYFRFTVNTNVIKIYFKYPEKLLTGMSNNEFFNLNYKITMESNGAYRRIKPHNYFFAYMQIYGVFSIFIFVYINKIFKMVLNKDNKTIFLIMFFYITFLGIGLSNYWLYLSLFTMMIYGNKETESINRSVQEK